MFVYYQLSSFVRCDLEILKRHFDVKDLRISTFRNPLNILKLFWGLLVCDLVYTWFAGTNAFFAVLFSKLLRKKSTVVVGGYDAAYIPEINYGIFTNRWRRVLAKFVYAHVNLVLVVDESLKVDVLRNTKLKIADKIKVVPTGYDENEWKPGVCGKENLVITVGAVNWSNLKRKGFEIFVKVAKHIPDVKFVLIGKHLDNSINYLKSIATSNVEFAGFLSENGLLRFYQRAKVYCQLSRYEGLPNALCEAMLCECIPVGTKYCGIPSAIGDVGFYVPYGDVNATVKALGEALNWGSGKGKAARERIKRYFSLKAREKKLIKEIISLFRMS
ncbi:glycosyltransferase family 4 protein [Candidatus Bathyarchaeota archaeon A05DMB-3]|nr:glycosyltransferase family 4 protein [Candidatus Bathyarchaeota archaeon A05DMB-3]